MRSPWRKAALVVFVLTLLAGGLFGGRLLALTDDARSTLRLFTELISVAHDGYGRELTYKELVEASINGMLQELDPHSSFLNFEDYTVMRDRQQSTFSGLGILVGMRNGQLTIITPIEGTPASRLGLRAGDHIDSIEGESTGTMGLDEAVRRLKGPRGTQVTITVGRPGFAEPLEFTITRDEIPQTTVRYAYMIEPQTGYIFLTDFNRGTGKEMSEAIARLQAEGMERLLFDLRGNGGGLLDQAIEVADLFLPDGARIVETKGRTRDSFQEFNATNDRPPVDLPVVVLVSQGSASASEIVAGAIQDHDVGLVAGTPTWGKGLVQTVYSLPYGAGLALTTARYYTPSGRLIQRDYTSWFDYTNPRLEQGEGLAAGLEPAGEEFRTDLGRTVYGGGGITPDILVEAEEQQPFLQFLLSRSAFFDYAVEYANRAEIESPDWRPSEEEVAAFVDWLVESEKVSAPELEEGLAEQGVAEAARRFLRAEVLNSVFGLEARFKALAEGDNQIRRGLTLFDEAGELLARRRALEADLQAALEPAPGAEAEAAAPAVASEG